MAREIKLDFSKDFKLYFQQGQVIFSTTLGPAMGPTHLPKWPGTGDFLAVKRSQREANQPPYLRRWFKDSMETPPRPQHYRRAYGQFCLKAVEFVQKLNKIL